MKVSYYIFYFYPYIPFKWQITKKKNTKPRDGEFEFIRKCIHVVLA
jgi:hypothetical protein